MNATKYRWILYTITLVIIATIGMQVYWNYKNYLNNKQQLINDVQTSLDKAVDDYYVNLAEKTTLGLSLSGDRQKNILDEGGFLEQLTAQIDDVNQDFSKLDINSDSLNGITVLRGFKADSMMEKYHQDHNPISIDSFSTQIKTLKDKSDESHFSDFEILTSKVVISISNDTLNIKDIDSLLAIELLRKNIDINYSLSYDQNNFNLASSNTFLTQTKDSLKVESDLALFVVSKSPLIPEHNELSVVFDNETQTVLKRILGSISLSFLLILGVISCLFYLLKIIKNQKQLAEVKNDLISNITHEFKTPIATIGVALESIKDFNGIEDKEKTKKYLNMSSDQLSKLNTMVEKLLETATLDSENVSLNLEKTNLVAFINTCIEKHHLLPKEKKLSFNYNDTDVTRKIDLFHFENAFNNIIDNAIKYGGDVITIDLKKDGKHIYLNISDDGTLLTKTHKDKVFEQFYRIPKGNTHDVKGFGIGLYYTKKIIEKHQGSITLDLSNNKTTFKIILPNG